VNPNSYGLSIAFFNAFRYFNRPRLEAQCPTRTEFAAGMYFLLISLYCLLAFLPYTYAAFIKTPPYAWMPFLVRHQAGLYWMALAAR